ncbi:rhodanese-like domain-containing protein [Halopseudomonas salegens]|uniref:Rhodanese-related sulfurtransferase n=1 Tax=Halopseudomonas salegens TaxID=1434072 RepID=A0A1H2HE16_9GAMM|nr:rhodanese-like domain-containing protein [Halopseudomonas salegens]SDU29959.1 Rhodanese-related sulfurtransferase [Halopseudomonas salegens]
MKNAHDLVVDAKAQIQEVSVQDAEAAIRNADALIDVRESDEFAAGHIAGAVNIPRGLLEFKLSSTPEMSARDLKLVLYCKTSGRAALAANSLQQMGYLNVQSISGGFEAWSDAGKPVVAPSMPSFD